MKLDNVTHQSAVQMRKDGASYSEIRKKLNVSKGTLSYWFSKEEWSRLVVNKLNKRRVILGASQIKLMNAERKRRLETRYAAIKFKAQEEFLHLKQEPLFLIGLSLYWGEGDKTHNGRVAVINSDPELLKTMARFYREILKIDEGKIRVAMFIYSDHNESSVKKYWTEELKVTSNQFIKTQILPSRSHHTKRRTEYGMCSVYFSSTELSIKIHQWIKILAHKMRE